MADWPMVLDMRVLAEVWATSLTLHTKLTVREKACQSLNSASLAKKAVARRIYGKAKSFVPAPDIIVPMSLKSALQDGRDRVSRSSARDSTTA
jgi:hypothetical protein